MNGRESLRKQRVKAFLEEYGYHYEVIRDKHNKNAWSLLSEDSAFSLIGFLQMRFGINRHQAKRIVCRSGSQPEYFFIQHIRFITMVDHWEAENL